MLISPYADFAATLRKRKPPPAPQGFSQNTSRSTPGLAFADLKGKKLKKTFPSSY